MALWDWLSYPFRRQARQPLAARQPSRHEMGQSQNTPLGMEATDLSMIDAVNRKNDALERSFGNRVENGQHLFGKSSLHVEALPNDETYAARFHRAFMTKGKSND